MTRLLNLGSRANGARIISQVTRILVANRGAIARRVVRACNEMGLHSIALYSDADAQAPHLAEASETVHLPGNRALETYLNQAAILQAAVDTGADSVHPGYGFLAENADFAEAVQAQGLTFVGPAPRWLRDMGDKIAARSLFADNQFPVFAGSAQITDAAHAQQLAQEIGFPVMLKPAGGGGGMGMEVVQHPDQLEAAMARAQAIAGQAFADSAIYLERWIADPRHIEFQILADGQGGAMHLFERECSVQRRTQKLIEESPAPGLSADKLALHADLAAQICGQLGYDNVGTLETLFTGEGDVGFLEMNTRIQVEHGVTEMVTGVDLVQQQIRLARGEPLPPQGSRQGFAVEARLYAEHAHTFMPSTGRLSRLYIPTLEGIRVECGYQQGQQITPYYDALIAKVIASGSTREMAIGRLLVALKAIEIEGVDTNAALLRSVLQDESFLAGQVDTGIVGRLLGGS
ncbi:MAG: biotin carboxylase N-terminal domain-containing protein [Pseudomonadota bacterium]